MVQEKKAQNSEEETDETGPLIVIVSNRGPFAFSITEEGEFEAKRGAGGLVTALSAVAERQTVFWVASAISEADRAWTEANPTGAHLADVDLRLINHPVDEYNYYYNEISNPLIWFIHHEMWDMPRSPVISRSTWEAWHDGYVRVNQRFAEVLADMVADQLGKREVLIFPQDYHLYMVPHFLRELVGDQAYIQPFIHIPWPGPDVWRVLPAQMRNTLLKSLLASDRVGFQTRKDAFNFVQTCRFFIDNAHSRGSRNSLEYDGHKVYATDYPISVNVEAIEEVSKEPATALMKELLLGIIGDRKLILRVDRIEPSKNILRGFQAYRALLEEHPEHRGNVLMMALLVPSRMGVDEYQSYLQDVLTEAGFINAEYSDEWWEPIRLILGDNYARAIAAMQLYDVLLVNPIADGMNLVAKEGSLINTRDGVLILSENAGAYFELGEHALSVAPTDVYGTAEAMHMAIKMDAAERKERATALRKIVTDNDVLAWFQSQLDDAQRASKSQAKKASTPATPSAK